MFGFAMNLLLLLSAILSALTGGTAPTRGAEPIVATRPVAAVAHARTAEQVRRPIHDSAVRVAPPRLRVALPRPPRPVVPLFLLRRRE